ncbi:phage tail protein [Niallia sp. Krafla_26]|uniref:phage tail protein n=1 Tax=Niallia sp. Krafla_26 TaxID=3064703 RepID=UPI003D170597
MYVRDLDGNEYPLQATSTNDQELNSNQSLTFRILPTKANNLFIKDISEMWEVVDHDDVPHKIIYFKKRGEGITLTVEIKAIPLFFDDFERDRIYEEYNKHMTASEFFTLLFNGTNYDFVLVDTFDAIQWEGLGKGNTRRSIFKDGLNRYGAEFKLIGTTVYLEAQVGRDTGFMYRHKLNASNIVQENDASSLYTYAKGFGNYADGEESNATLIREYTSPIASIIDIRHAPPIYDGRITDPDTMDSKLKTLVDESLKVSVSADIHDLRKQNYPIAQSEVGDRVFLIDERINLNTEVRVVSQSKIRDWRGNVIGLRVTFGSPGITKRYQSNINTAVSNIKDVMSGRKKIPFTALDNAVMQATKDLQNVQTELVIPPNGGWMAVDKDDPNKLVLFNSAGIGISDDGGQTFKTAMTGSGIVADVITAGTLRGINIEQVSEYAGLKLYNGLVESYYNGNLAMRFGQYSFDFYNRDRELTGKIVTNHTSDNENKGLGIHFYNEFISIAEAQPGLGTTRPVFYSSTWDKSTDVLGPYSEGESFLRLFANERLWEETHPRARATDQPCIILQEGSEDSSVYHYYGGYNKRNGSTWKLYYNYDETSVYPRIIATDKGVELYGIVRAVHDIYIGEPSTGINAAVVTYPDAAVYWQANNNSMIRQFKDGTVDFIINGAGNFAVFPSGNGQVAGAFFATEFNPTSSATYKQNIKLYEENATEWVRDINVYEYHLTSDLDKLNFTKKIGFIAETLPDKLKGSDGMSVNLYGLLSVLWKAVKEQQQTIDDLSERIKTLELIA